MELLNRYLETVRKHLPWERHEDILAELRANLESQLEEREEDLGRPLSPAEMESWVKALGSPIQMASHYKPQQYLIGPAVFPTYWYVLRTSFFWAVAIYFVANVVEIVASEHPSWAAVLRTVLHAPWVMLMCAACVTAVFAALEYVMARYPGKWPEVTNHFTEWVPDNLPSIEDVIASTQKRRSYAKAVAEIIFGFFALGWLLLIPKYPYLWLGPSATYFQNIFELAPVWTLFYRCILVLNVVQLVWRCVVLSRGEWQFPRPVQEIAIKIFGLIAVIIPLTAQDHILITLKHPLVDGARFGQAVDMINTWTYRGLLIPCAIIVVQLIWEIGKVSMETYRRP